MWAAGTKELMKILVTEIDAREQTENPRIGDLAVVQFLETFERMESSPKIIDFLTLFGFAQRYARVEQVGHCRDKRSILTKRKQLKRREYLQTYPLGVLGHLRGCG